MNSFNKKYYIKDWLVDPRLKDRYEIIPNSQTPKVEEIENVNEFIRENKKGLEDFRSFASSRFGPAVSANQVSVDGKRLIYRCFAITDMVDFFNLNDIPGWKIIINPVILEHIGEEQTKYEGCMSFECNTIEAKRSPDIKVSYYDINGRKFENEIYSGFKAQVWQHEVNHLNGVVEHKLPKTYLEKTACKTSSLLFPLPPVQVLK